MPTDVFCIFQRLLSSHVTEMDGELLQKHVHLPLYPSVLAVGVEWTKCKYFSSLTLPVKISFRTLNSNYDVLHKVRRGIFVKILMLIRIWINYSQFLGRRRFTTRCFSFADGSVNGRFMVARRVGFANDNVSLFIYRI